jgi:predicted Zn-dependent protease
VILRFLAAALLGARLAVAQPAPADPVLDSLADELARSTAALDMGRLGKPYFISYQVHDGTTAFVSASFGSVVESYDTRSRLLKVGLRVGSPDFDNADFVPRDFWSYRPITQDLTQEDGYAALRFSAWSATDDAYKAALQRLAQKRAYRQARMIAERLPDLSTAPVRGIWKSLASAASERAAWEAETRRASALFRGYPAVQHSNVRVYCAADDVRVLDSEGRRSLRRDGDSALVVEASAQAPDGMELSDRRRVVAPDCAGLPRGAALDAEAAALARDLTALAGAPTLEAYVGPVLFEGQAAGEFFTQLLARNVGAPRAPWVEEDNVKDRFRAGELTDRLGLRVASPLLSVSDDPTVPDFEGTTLAGSYPFDDEGVPPERVELVKDGILVDLLMSRAAVKARSRSNGHGRASFGELVTARPGNLIIRSRRGLPAAKLKDELLRQAREFGLDYGLIVRRMSDESRQEEGDRLSPPILVYKAYVANGREELIRGMDFDNVTMRALRDVSAASQELRVYNTYQLGPYRDARGELAIGVVHPSVLVAEMELKKSEAKPARKPYLPHPFFAH